MLTGLNIEHIPEIIKISDSLFGSDFISSNDLKIYINNILNKAFVLIEENQIVGFITICISTPNELQEQTLKEKKWFFNEFQNYSKIGFIKQVLIHPNHQKKGLGKKLVKSCIQSFKNEIDTFICLAWRKGNSIPIEKVLLGNRFIEAKTISNYWFTDSLENKYTCLICGNPPCKCSAIVYIRK